MHLKNLFAKWFTCNKWGKDHLTLTPMVGISALVGQEVENHEKEGFTVDGTYTLKYVENAFRV